MQWLKLPQQNKTNDQHIYTGREHTHFARYSSQHFIERAVQSVYMHLFSDIEFHVSGFVCLSTVYNRAYYCNSMMHIAHFLHMLPHFNSHNVDIYFSVSIDEEKW